MFRATLDGFTDPDHAELLEPYASGYFDVVGDIWRDWSRTWRSLRGRRLPGGGSPTETIAATDDYIDRADPPAALRRLLIEGRDDVARALRCQDRDRQAE